jgi:hypothetical protein
MVEVILFRGVYYGNPRATALIDPTNPSRKIVPGEVPYEIWHNVDMTPEEAALVPWDRIRRVNLVNWDTEGPCVSIAIPETTLSARMPDSDMTYFWMFPMNMEEEEVLLLDAATALALQPTSLGCPNKSYLWICPSTRRRPGTRAGSALWRSPWDCTHSRLGADSVIRMLSCQIVWELIVPYLANIVVFPRSPPA